jgi:predicted ribosome quality control (RQC) complex YloA/Tae2 family protein
MENFFLSSIIREVATEVQGRNVARVSLAGSHLLIDLRLSKDRVLLASLDRTSPAIFLSDAKLRPADSDVSASHPFISLLKKHIGGAKLVRLSKEPLDRIVRLDFEKFDAAGDHVQNSIVLVLTGRTTNAYLTDAHDNALAAFTDAGSINPDAGHHFAKEPIDLDELLEKVDESISLDEALGRVFGQSSPFSPQVKDEFIARSRHLTPASAFKSLLYDLVEKEPQPLIYSSLPMEEVQQRMVNFKTDVLLSHFEMVQARGKLRYQFSSLSEAAEQYYRARELQKALREEYNSVKQLLVHDIKKIEAALAAIEKDSARFEDPDRLKRFGELIHANLATARVEGTKALVVDYYDPEQPEIEIELNDKKSLLQAAADYFARYQKARRALTAIALRRDKVGHNLEPLKRLLRSIEEGPDLNRVAQIREEASKLTGRRSSAHATGETRKSVRERNAKSAGRRFKTSDGYEIAVGRNDRENDELTFRVARPNDIWMHAADYPGSHVVIRNPTRGEVPSKVILAGAELAAFYSQAKREGKAAVHYTLKKFVSKPPKAKPGLVRLSSFKTLMVEPRCDLDKLD